jgi:hypothetical protein
LPSIRKNKKTNIDVVYFGLALNIGGVHSLSGPASSGEYIISRTRLPFSLNKIEGGTIL